MDNDTLGMIALLSIIPCGRLNQIYNCFRLYDVTSAVSKAISSGYAYITKTDGYGLIINPLAKISEKEALSKLDVSWITCLMKEVVSEYNKKKRRDEGKNEYNTRRNAINIDIINLAKVAQSIAVNSVHSSEIIVTCIRTIGHAAKIYSENENFVVAYEYYGLAEELCRKYPVDFDVIAKNRTGLVPKGINGYRMKLFFEQGKCALREGSEKGFNQALVCFQHAFGVANDIHTDSAEILIMKAQTYCALAVMLLNEHSSGEGCENKLIEHIISCYKCLCDARYHIDACLPSEKDKQEVVNRNWEEELSNIYNCFFTNGSDFANLLAKNKDYDALCQEYEHLRGV